MGKRATVTQVVHTKSRDGFIEDPFWGPTRECQRKSLPAGAGIKRERDRGPSPDACTLLARTRAAPKAIAHLPAAIDQQGREHLRAALGLALRHLEGREVNLRALASECACASASASAREVGVAWVCCGCAASVCVVRLCRAGEGPALMRALYRWRRRLWRRLENTCCAAL